MASVIFRLTRRSRASYFVYERIDVMPYEDCIAYLLAKAYQRAHACAKRRFAEYGLTPVQQLVLAGLWHEEGTSAGDLGKRLGLDPATLSGILDRMSERGWVVKQTDLEDKRALRIMLTDAARDLKPRLLEARDKANEEILKNLSFEERVLLKRLLKDLRD
jgi:MarR family transcriptional regulator, lower aerobic nicotinate degradation pathway regulator